MPTEEFAKIFDKIALTDPDMAPDTERDPDCVRRFQVFVIRDLDNNHVTVTVTPKALADVENRYLEPPKARRIIIKHAGIDLNRADATILQAKLKRRFAKSGVFHV